MAPFGTTLGRDQRTVIVACIQSWSPDPIYAKWQEIGGHSR